MVVESCSYDAKTDQTTFVAKIINRNKMSLGSVHFTVQVFDDAGSVILDEFTLETNVPGNGEKLTEIRKQGKLNGARYHCQVHAVFGKT